MGSDLQLVESIILKGVAKTTIRKLVKAGYTTLESIAFAPPREVSNRTNMTYNTADKVCRIARDETSDGFIPLGRVLKDHRDRLKCHTGSTELDRILGGGVATGDVTELIGEFGTGKSQICFTLAMFAHLPSEQGGLDGKTCFIDTEGTFIPERVEEIAESRGYDPEEALSSILVARAYNSRHQMNLIFDLSQVCQENDVRLVVVDSMIGHFRGEYVGRKNLSERQQKLASCLSSLRRLAEAHQVAVVVTNQVHSVPKIMFGDPNRPTGGHVMAHASTHRVYLRNGRKNTSLVQVIDSPILPLEKIRIAITDKGIEDA